MLHPGYPNGAATGLLVKDYRGKDANQVIWKLDSALESRIADINNVGSGGQAGAITAALFMRRFVTAKSWAHFDVFAWSPRNRPARPEGGDCQAARALYALLAARFG